MKINLSLLLAMFFTITTYSQNVENIDPTLEDHTLYTKKEQKEWYEIINLFKALENGQIEYESELNIEQKALIDSLESGLGPFTDGVGCSWYCGGGPAQINNTSLEYDTITTIFENHNLHDFNLLTSWMPSLKSKDNKINFYFKKDTPRMNAIVIWNGNQKNSNDWESYGRAKSIKVFVNNKPMYILNLEDSSHKQVFEVEKLESIHIDKDLLLTFEFLDSYPGIDFNILSISEINFDGKSH